LPSAKVIRPRRHEDTKVLFLRNKNKVEGITALKTLSKLGGVSSTPHYGYQSGLFEKIALRNQGNLIIM
jgi:hypothetical protein